MSDLRRSIMNRCRQVVDAGLLASIVLVPLLMGGRLPVGQLALVVIAVATAAAWLVSGWLSDRPRWQVSGAEWLLLAAVALVGFQLVPLPSDWLAWLSPRMSQLLPLWDGDAPAAAASLGRWDCLSLHPAATRTGLGLLSAYALLFLVATQRIEKLDDVERLLRWLAWATVGMAVFAIVQYTTSNGRFFWVYEHPLSDTHDAAKGSFTNRNHLAHFLALGLGPLLWWIATRRRARRHARRAERDGHRPCDLTVTLLGRPWRLRAMWLDAAVLGVVVLAVLLPLSRGGAAAMFVAGTVCVGAFARLGEIKRRDLGAIAGAGLLLVVGLSLFGEEAVARRWHDVTDRATEDLGEHGGRGPIWAAVGRAMGDFPAVGAGVGSHVELYPIYLDRSLPYEYTHAESGYLQLAEETGTAGVALLAMGVGLLVFWCCGTLWRNQSRRVTMCMAAVSASLAASLVHSVVDFVWYVPALMAITTLLAACAARLWRLSDHLDVLSPCHFVTDGGTRSARPTLRTSSSCHVVTNGGTRSARPTLRLAGDRVPIAVMSVLLLIGGGAMIGDRLRAARAWPPWESYLTLSARSFGRGCPTRPQAAALPPGSDLPEADTSFAVVAVMRQVGQLEQVVRYQPDHARAHLRLARLYRRLFELKRHAAGRMPLSQIRAADEAAEFPDAQARSDWLRRAVGAELRLLHQARYHAGAAVRLCPLQGEGYLHLAALDWLDRADDAASDAYRQQALRVRPHDGYVLIEAGRQVVLEGRWERGVAYWQRAFRCDRSARERLLTMLAGRVPVGYIVTTFRPEFDAMRYLLERCHALGDPACVREARLALLPVAEAEARHLEASSTDRSADDRRRAADVWCELARLYCDLDQPNRALHAAGKSRRWASGEFPIHYRLAKVYLDVGRCSPKLAGALDEAATELRWCQAQRPDDPRVATLLKRVFLERGERSPRSMPVVAANGRQQSSPRP